jgi:hypothetical protein
MPQTTTIPGCVALATLLLLAGCGGDDDGAGDAGSGAADAAHVDATGRDGGACVDDDAEDDDDFNSARVPNYEDDMREEYTGDQICAGDEDWFYVFLFPNETLQVSLSFAQSGAAEDLDLQFYDGSCDLGTQNCTLGQLLTPCTDADQAGCDAGNGQSRDANETFSFTATTDTAGDHWFVVRGFQGAENGYDLCTAISPETCF